MSNLEGQQAAAPTRSRMETRWTDTTEEGWDLKDYKYTITGGTGKYAGASGGELLCIREHHGHPGRRHIQGHNCNCPDLSDDEGSGVGLATSPSTAASSARADNRRSDQLKEPQ